MSQPPQGGWGPQDNSAGQDGYGQGYGQASPNSYGQGYDQSYGQPSADAYGQGSANSYGGYDASFGQGDMSGEQPKKGGAGKIALFVCIGCAVLALIAGLIGGGIFLFTRGGDDGGQTQGQEQGKDDGGDTGGDEGGDTGGDEGGDGGSDQGGDTGGDKGGDTGATGGDKGGDTGGDKGGDKGGDTGATGGGTRDNPLALGETFTLNDGEGGTIDVQLGEVNWDATQAMMEANQFNDQPGEGERYILVPVTVTYHGDGSLSPAFGVHVEYVSSGGNSFSPGGVTPNSALEVGELYDGGNATYDLAYIVPDDAVQDGLFKAEVLLSFEDDPVWIAAK